MSPWTEARTARAFERLLVHAPIVLVVSLVLIAAAAAGLTRLVKDTSLDAFVPPDHPSIQANAQVTEEFGLSDSIAVAVMSADGGSVFRPHLLETIATLTEEIAQLPNVRAERVRSLATESSIRGADGALLVDPYVGDLPLTPADAGDAERRWHDMPPHVGTLAAADATGGIILAEVLDLRQAAQTYARVESLVAAYRHDGVDILVAGPAAVSAVLSQQIDQDARLLQPLVFLLVLTFIYLAFRRAAALLGPLLLVTGAAGGALGVMAWQGVPYFAITNALPVIIVAISVADAIHILSTYYRLRATDPKLSPEQAIVGAMTEMARPITLTTLTTMAGFAGIGLVSIMPPIVWFAWYAALGVALAWLFSIVTLPCCLKLLRLGPSPAFRSWQHHRPSALGRALAAAGAFASRRHGLVLAGFAGVLLLAAAGAAQLRIDRSQVENFAAEAPIRQADERINAAFAGTAFLDVIVEAGVPEGLLSPRNMQRLAALQAHFESLPHVAKTASIADYLSLMHGALTEAPAAERALPHEENAIAQYLLVYEASGDPADLEEEITPGYDMALIRGILDTSYFSENRQAVEGLQRYVDEHFADGELRATLGGDVNVAYHWMTQLKNSHFLGVGLSLVMVLLMAMVVFRSIGTGLLAVVPVASTVLVIYAVMGFLGIHLEPATSMFAAISVGVGVDFAIHLIDRLRWALREHGGDLAAAINAAMPATARACLFNAAALGIGFSTLLASDLPTLQRFGSLVAVATLSSFAITLIIVPALYGLALSSGREAVGRLMSTAPGRASAGLILVGLTLGFAAESRAEEDSGREIAERVAARAEGHFASRFIHMTLTDRRGRERQRRAWVLRRNDDDVRRTRITYLAPKAVREVAFLSHDYRAAAHSDDRWLYIPAARKVRRIPASKRGDYFLGTDFTYEDMQSDLKFDTADYEFRHEGTSSDDGRTLHTLSGRPVTPQVARQLGYGGFRALVDAATWMPVDIEFADLDGQPLKTIQIHEVAEIDGIWTALDIEARNHQTGHTTRFEISEVSYAGPVAEWLFTSASLSRGVPEL